MKLWNWIAPIRYRGPDAWYDRQVFFINENGNRELRGHWGLLLVIGLMLGSTYVATHTR